MRDRLPENRLIALLAGLAPLAELVGAGGPIDRNMLRDLASSVGVVDEPWVVEELALWSEILSKAAEAKYSKTATVAELRSRGIPDFPAVLAYEVTTKKTGVVRSPSLTVEPTSIDFGVVRCGESCSKSLKVRGALVRAVAASQRVNLKSTTSGDGSIVISVTVSGGLPGELLKDQITLIGENGYRLTVELLAQWAQQMQVPVREPKWCPRCVPQIGYKSLHYVEKLNRYQCDRCEKTFALDDPTVARHNHSGAPPVVSFTVEPPSIDFGTVAARQKSTRTLRVRGKIVRAVANSKRLDLNWTTSDDGTILIGVTVSGGSPGESLASNIVLIGDPGEVNVAVTARWREQKKFAPPNHGGQFLLLWCPNCKSRIRWKSLLYVEGLKRYRCSNCGHTFSLDDENVIDANY